MMPRYKSLLALEKHIEGGYFKVFYNSEDIVTPVNPRYTLDSANSSESCKRIASTSIYFLLENDDFSAWHRLKSDEIWHYYDGGSPIDIHVITPEGKITTQTLGNPAITNNAAYQTVIKAGCWFAAEVREKNSFALVGCTVSPGFEYKDFELGERAELTKQYSHLQSIIEKFTRDKSTDRTKTISKYTYTENTKQLFTAGKYIELLKLEKHIEGGYFGIFYTSEDNVIPLDARYKSDKSTEPQLSEHRSATSSIYFLLDKNDFSAWHKLKSDELWHYYDGGSPIDLHIISPTGELSTVTLGNPLLTENASFQLVIKADHWFAAEVRDKNSFGLVGCTVSPGFEYKDFELAERSVLIQKYEDLKEAILKFTRDHSAEEAKKNESTSFKPGFC